MSRRNVLDRTQVLVNEIESFCEEYGIAESTFGRMAVNDGKFVGRIRAGRSAGKATVEAVDGFMRRVHTGEITLRGRGASMMSQTPRRWPRSRRAKPRSGQQVLWSFTNSASAITFLPIRPTKHGWLPSGQWPKCAGSKSEAPASGYSVR